MKKLILSLFISTILYSCEYVAKKIYGITDPQLETTESIRQYAQKMDLGIENVLVLNDYGQYKNMMENFNSAIPEAILFDAEGHQVSYKENKEDCNAGLFSTLPNLRKNTSLKKEDLILTDFQKNFLKLDGTPLSEIPKSDYYLFLNWAKFVGKLNKDHVKVWEEMAKKNKYVKIQVYNVNMDIQKKWNVKELPF